MPSSLAKTLAPHIWDLSQSHWFQKREEGEGPSPAEFPGPPPVLVQGLTRSCHGQCGSWPGGRTGGQPCPGALGPWLGPGWGCSLSTMLLPSFPTSSIIVGAVIRKQLGESFLPFLENASLLSMGENIGPLYALSGSGTGVEGEGNVSPQNGRERREARLFSSLFLQPQPNPGP